MNQIYTIDELIINFIAYTDSVLHTFFGIIGLRTERICWTGLWLKLVSPENFWIKKLPQMNEKLRHTHKHKDELKYLE